VLVCTSTLAWGVNFPAHLVVVKGTEYYDGKSKRYVDFPITDVLQMMGRAGRPQFDQHGVAVILVHEPKKSFYKKVSRNTRGGQPGQRKGGTAGTNISWNKLSSFL
jgi:activating signal cointegrator complex subunit 3